MSGIYADISKKVGTDIDTEMVDVPPLSVVSNLLTDALDKKDVAAFCRLMTIKRFGDATNEEEYLCLKVIEDSWPQIIKEYL